MKKITIFGFIVLLSGFFLMSVFTKSTYGQTTPIFSDVPASHYAFTFIETLYRANISAGCGTSPLKYCPEESLTRAQAAVFLLRAEHGASYIPPDVGASTGFADVPTTYYAAGFIKQLVAEGITAGCGSGNFCPDSTITRAQMAVFLIRAKHGSSYVPPAVGASTGFTDVPVDYYAASYIKQLVSEGVAAGCGANIFCPDSPLTRAQAAVFIVKTFNIIVVPNSPTPTPGGCKTRPACLDTVPPCMIAEPAEGWCPALTITPPVDPACVCADNTCSASCTFDKFTDVNYNNPIKCSQDNTVFISTPTTDDKNGWCQSTLRTKGNANGPDDTNIDMTDYYYYVAAINGGKIPTAVNVDFDGDGIISTLDRAIVVRSLPAN